MVALAGIEEVAERLRRALYKNEALVIFGHDDPDGVTSTYILYQSSILRLSEASLLHTK
jgi:single-stranded DNA-specific DHH superfamily exonuclease